jgi:hypothetical protein
VVENKYNFYRIFNNSNKDKNNFTDILNVLFLLKNKFLIYIMYTRVNKKSIRISYNSDRSLSKRFILKKNLMQKTPNYEIKTFYFYKIFKINFSTFYMISY